MRIEELPGSVPGSFPDWKPGHSNMPGSSLNELHYFFIRRKQSKQYEWNYSIHFFSLQVYWGYISSYCKCNKIRLNNARLFYVFYYGSSFCKCFWFMNKIICNTHCNCSESQDDKNYYPEYPSDKWINFFKNEYHFFITASISQIRSSQVSESRVSILFTAFSFLVSSAAELHPITNQPTTNNQPITILFR